MSAQAGGELAVSRETRAKIECYVELLLEETARQNLIAASTVDDLWQRHIVDSAQLTALVPAHKSWVDVGSGAGLPGILIAIITGAPTLLVEPRRLRAEFLQRVVTELAMENATVAISKVEQVQGKFDVVTARAVASLTKLLGITAHLAHSETIWVLPKGRNAKSELAEAERSWHYEVRAEPSCTDPEASILLLTNVRAKAKR